MNEELREDIDQTLQENHEALIGRIIDSFDQTKKDVEKLIRDHHLVSFKGATIKMRGDVRLALVFPLENRMFETETTGLNLTEDLDLEQRCAHWPDWKTVDTSDFTPRVKCLHCDAVAMLSGPQNAWGLIEDGTWTKEDGSETRACRIKENPNGNV